MRVSRTKSLLHTESLKENHEFRRLYYRGKCASGRAVAVYCLKNRRGLNRLGLTVGAKLGCAVERNRIRRRLRECYRAFEPELKLGYDVVIVARGRAVGLEFGKLRAELSRAFGSLGLICAPQDDKNDEKGHA